MTNIQNIQVDKFEHSGREEKPPLQDVADHQTCQETEVQFYLTKENPWRLKSQKFR